MQTILDSLNTALAAAKAETDQSPHLSAAIGGICHAIEQLHYHQSFLEHGRNVQAKILADAKALLASEGN